MAALLCPLMTRPVQLGQAVFEKGLQISNRFVATTANWVLAHSCLWIAPAGRHSVRYERVHPVILTNENKNE